MRVISRKALKDFAREHAGAEASLDAWYRLAKSAEWASIDDVRKTYPHADFASPYTIFNIKGNTYRVLVIIKYRYQLVLIKHVMTHAEYDKAKWK
jgi:mRNA interferase HigB